MKKIHLPLFIGVWLGLAGNTFGQGRVSVTDGPYLSYQDGQIRVATIVKDDDLLKVKTETYSPDHKPEIVLTVTPEGHPDWQFKVNLKANIENEAPISPAAGGRTLFISDIEGEFANFRSILIASKVIDEQYNWSYGTGSLVIAGDLFDRGKDVVPELWLLYKLEDEAKAAGGSVHTLLGNHDIMNLSGDHRYTEAKYFKNAWLLKRDVTTLFGKDTELGRWLRSKNIIEKIGDILVLHGGVSPALNKAAVPLEQFNDDCRPYYDQKLKDIPVELRPFFAGQTAPFWYRGYFMAPKISIAGLDSTLNLYNCKQVVVGHTIIKRNIAMYYKGKIIAIDVDEHTQKPAAALYENGKWFVIDDKGKTRPLAYKPGNDNIKESDIL